MNKEKYLQFVASFLVVLIITIPYYVSQANATINKVTVKGSGGIEGYAKSDDFLNFNVKASISNVTIANTQVFLGNDIQFDACTPSISNGSECTLKFPSSGTESFEAKSVPFTIRLLKDNRTTDDTKSSTVTIDTKAPQLTLKTSKDRYSSRQNASISYDVTDYACDDPSCSNKCVGIKKIDFYTQDGSFKQTNDTATSRCNIKSSIIVDTKTFRNGQTAVFAKATDNFDQVSQETSITFIVDTSPPEIVTNSFSIMVKDIGVDSFAPNSVSADVSINITASDLDANSVTADLYAFNPSQNLKNVKASCTSNAGNSSLCKWSVQLNPKTAGVKTITINANDTSGNTGSITISKTLSLDDKGPKVQSLSTTQTIGDKVFGKTSGNTIIASFDEASGLNADSIFLHVSNSKIKANSCSKDTNWVCVWNNVNLGSSAQISLQSDSTDIFGNAISESTNVNVIVDLTPPALRSINISPVGGLVQAFPGVFKVGDKIAVVANLTEENDVSAVADFSSFVSGASKVAASCEKIQNDENVCTWLTDAINLQSSDVIRLNFTDSAGNTLFVTRPLKTLGLDNAASPDFWSNSVECSPKAVDRSLGPLINERVFCQVKLMQKASPKPVSTVFIGPASCTGASIVQGVDTFNTETGSTSPIIEITLNKDNFKINNASLSCSFNIFSKIGDSTTITKNPEIENVKINLQFFNLPLGELSNEVNRKIDAAKKDADGIYKLIGALNKLMYFAKKICQLYGVLYNIVAIMYTITFWLKAGTDVCTKSLFGIGYGVCAVQYKSSATFCGAQQAKRETVQTGWKAASQFCKFVNCQWAPGFLGKIQDYVAQQINRLPGSNYLPQGENQMQSGLAQYLDPKSNLITATLFVCIPGIIYSLDKYRQIKCLYADCLQNAVGRDGLPITACEDEKAYATCKYVYGEIFAVFPYTAVLDHFLGLIKEALSNPFTAIGVGLSAMCWATCPVPPPASSSTYVACEGFKILTTLGNVIGDVKNIIDEGFKVRTDYCSRLKQNQQSVSATTNTPSQGPSTQAIPQKNPNLLNK